VTRRATIVLLALLGGATSCQGGGSSSHHEQEAWARDAIRVILKGRDGMPPLELQVKTTPVLPADLYLNPLMTAVAASRKDCLAGATTAPAPSQLSFAVAVESGLVASVTPAPGDPASACMAKGLTGARMSPADAGPSSYQIEARLVVQREAPR